MFNICSINFSNIWTPILNNYYVSLCNILTCNPTVFSYY